MSKSETWGYLGSFYDGLEVLVAFGLVFHRSWVCYDWTKDVKGDGTLFPEFDLWLS